MKIEFPDYESASQALEELNKIPGVVALMGQGEVTVSFQEKAVKSIVEKYNGEIKK